MLASIFGMFLLSAAIIWVANRSLGGDDAGGARDMIGTPEG
ncbi:hypothetical protein [Tranquillimonas rosea]